MERTEFEAARRAYREFLANPEQRLFEHRFAGGRRDVEFCICSASMYGPLEFLWLHARYGLLMFVLALPWSLPKVVAYRLMGARIGRRVYISQRVYLDPLYPQLLTVGDDVLIGFGAQLFFHEITQRAYRVGRVVLEDGCLIGAGAMLRPGITIGRDAQVCGMTAVAHDVPPGAAVLGVPARPIGQGPQDPAAPEVREDLP